MDFLELLPQVLSPINLLYSALGTFVGIVFGALPGLTAAIGITLLLPVTYGLNIYSSMALLLGLYCGAMYGGSITAILIETPGTASAAATMIDGHPLARQGKAGLALSAALKASFCGGIISATLLLFIAPVLAQAALAFGPPEMFSLALVGLTIIPTMVGNSMPKGFIACFLGLMVAMVGQDPISGVSRLTFGSLRVASGIEFVPTLIGLFAFSQILTSLFDINKPAGDVNTFSKSTFSWFDIIKNWFCVIRSALIGSFVGAIPGTGAAIASFMSYNEAKKASKKPETFGTGNPEGIIAAEAANNAVTGSALIPTLTLGIPGDPVTAILVSAFLINGITVGPRFFSDQADIAYFVIFVMFLSNIMMLLQGTFLIRLFAQVVKVPTGLMLPILSVFTIIGAYSVNSAIFDVGIMICFGIVGFLFNRLGIPKVPFVIATVLGSMAESNLRRGLLMSGGSLDIFFESPICVVCIVIALGSLLLPTVRKRLAARKKQQAV